MTPAPHTSEQEPDRELARLVEALLGNPAATALLRDPSRAHLIVDLAGTIVEATSTAEAVLGLDRAALVGSALAEIPALGAPEPDGLNLSARIDETLARAVGGAKADSSSLEGFAEPVQAPATRIDAVVGAAGEPIGVVVTIGAAGRQEPDQGGLSGQQRLLHAVFQRTFELIALLSPEGELLDITEHIAAFGFARSEILGRRLADVLAEHSPELAQRWHQTLADTTASGEPQRTVTVLKPGDLPGLKEELAVETSLSPVPGDDGATEVLFLEVRDQTDRHRAEIRRRESEERFRLLAETLPQMVWASDPAGQIDYFGPRWSDFTGLSLDELRAGAWLDLVHPEDRVVATTPPPADSDALDDRVFRLRNADGEYRWLESQARALRDDDGAIVRWFGSTLDFTERRRAEDRQRAQAEQLEAGAELAGQGTFIWEMGAGEDQVHIDARYRRIHGLPPGALPNQPIAWWLSRLHPDDRRRVVAAADAACVPGGPSFQEEYRFLRDTPDGPEERWLACLGRVEFHADGRPHRMIGTVQDVTLARLQDEMRARVQKVEAIGTLVGAVAHDFNNVIGAILTYARVASAELEDGQAPTESLREIARGAHRAADILGRLMTFSREEVPQRLRYSLAAVIDEALALLRPTFSLDTRVVIEIDESLPALMGDPTQIHQVMVNLLTNARQAIGEQPGVVEVRVTDEQVSGEAAEAAGVAPGRYARIVVSDTGPGFPAAVAHRLFDPFFTTKPAGQGTGLGLAAVQSIVAAHGGTAAALAPTDGGAVFTVRLPISAPIALAAPADPLRKADGPVAEGRPLRVLFVDDEAALVRLAQRAMPRHGYAVRGFVNPREAVAFAHRTPDAFDVVVTDLTMPQMDGLALIEELRALRPGIPVVLTSGYLSAQAEASARAAGVNAILSKPSSMEALAAAIDEIAGA